MKTRSSINHGSYIRQLVKLAAFTFLAMPVFAQTYTVTDLGTLGRNSLGSYSIAYCINGSGQVAGESSASSTQMSDPGFLYSNGQLINIGTLGAVSIPQGRSPVTPRLRLVLIVPSSTQAAK